MTQVAAHLLTPWILMRSCRLSLWVDLDALRVQGAAQLWRVLLVIDPMDLRCCEGHNLRDRRLVSSGS